MMHDSRIAIGIITYHRPAGLRRLLESLTKLEFRKAPAPIIEVVVVDNDEAESARGVCEEMAASLNLVYLVEKERGISFARNAVLRHALPSSDFIAFVDDDEVVEPDWLDELLDAQQRFGADVVAGPVLPVFVEPPPEWIVAGNFFERKRYATGTALKYVASCNVLVRSNFLENSEVWFDERFALSGGGDTHFFMRLGALGAVMVWSDEAVVHEWVPASRMTEQWILKRAYRGGNSYSLCERALNDSLRGKAVRMVKGSGHLLLGGAKVLLSIGQRPHLTHALRQMALGAGMISGSVGSIYEEYSTIHPV